MWEATRKLKRAVTSIRKCVYSCSRNNKRKADIFADHQAEVFTLDRGQEDAEQQKIQSENSINMKLVTPQDITKEIIS